MNINTVRSLFVLTLGVTLLASGAATAQPTSADAPTEAIARPKHDLELGFPVGGRVAEIAVDPGERVEAGQLLARLEDRQGKELVKLWKVRAESDIQVRLRQKQVELAELKVQQLKELRAKDAAAPFEYEQAKVEAELARIEMEQARQSHREAQSQHEQAKARHEQYVLRAPEPGVIERVNLEAGETVDPRKAVLRLVRIDHLRIDASVPVSETLGLSEGDPAWASFRVSGYDDEPIEGRITHLASVADPASDTRRVRIEVPNARKLPAGCRVTVRFSQTSATAAASSE